MTTASDTVPPHRRSVTRSLASAPIFGVVRTASRSEAEHQARAFVAAGLELIEVTFTVPEASSLIRQLRSELGNEEPPWVGAGTVTNVARAKEALAAGAQFIVTPNVNPEVASLVVEAGVFLAVGALTTTEICAARDLGADIVKVYPLPPVGGARYLEIVRQPLPDIPILAAGGFGADEIPLYRAAGATAYGIGSQLLGSGDEREQRARVQAALALARGE